MSNPIDEALMSKEAIFGGAVQRVGQSMGGEGARDLSRGFREGVGAAAGTLLAGAVFSGAKKLWSAANERREFNEMLDTDPGLRDYQKDNPKFFNKAYKSLRQLNPTYGRDPIVASNMMRKMMDSPVGAGHLLAGSFRQPDAPRDGQFSVSVGNARTPAKAEYKF